MQREFSECGNTFDSSGLSYGTYTCGDAFYDVLIRSLPEDGHRAM